MKSPCFFWPTGPAHVFHWQHEVSSPFGHVHAIFWGDIRGLFVSAVERGDDFRIDPFMSSHWANGEETLRGLSSSYHWLAAPFANDCCITRVERCEGLCIATPKSSKIRFKKNGNRKIPSSKWTYGKATRMLSSTCVFKLSDNWLQASVEFTNSLMHVECAPDTI